MSPVSWNDIYTDLWTQAAESRGTVTCTGELPGTTRYSSLAEWPRTTGADVIAIASLVDPILNETPLRPGGYGITRLWQTAVIELESLAFPNPATEYAHNRAFWSTLLAVAAHLSAMGTPVAPEEAWETVVTALWSPANEQRNAGGLTTRTMTAKSFTGMWSALQGELAALRGFDLRDDGLGRIIEVPRTTHADVLQLERYWTRLLVQLQLRVLTGAVPETDGFEDVQVAWQELSQRIEVDALGGESTRVHPENAAFWMVSRALATVLDRLEQHPPPYAIVDKSTQTAGQSPSQTPPGERSYAGDLSGRIERLVDGALSAVSEVVHDAGNRVVATIGRPLLITGATVATLLFILRATTPSPQREGGAELEAKAE